MLKIVLKRAAGLLALTLAVAAQAAPVWQQTDNLTSTLSGIPGYSTNGTVATVTYLNQSATNIGPTAQHMGLYIAWNWVYDSAGASTALLWDNTTQSFVGDHVSLTVSRPGFGDEFLRLGDVLDDTWVGNPWSPGGGETAIASQADWEAPLLDLGEIGAGQSASYDLQLTYSFDSLAALSQFDSIGVWGQGVQSVPEPAPLALVVAGFAALAFTRRRA